MTVDGLIIGVIGYQPYIVGLYNAEQKTVDRLGNCGVIEYKI
ncbi:MAG: hypothetical protein RMX68_029380 [Aulosira sp. ZfuVER01]|nr:hypothetical protein [Aulosira sp. ZfuVER01]MDZ8002863.1 hypothetical protein [Aulosira sp. DedVER01a]MDZ8056525.1 hypothetical protein [Aulosira sp. ZfuCHP01]